MQPWRFKLIRGRGARPGFADVLVAAALAHDPATPQRQLDKIRSRTAARAAGHRRQCALRDNPKVPEIEQTLAVGAAVNESAQRAARAGLRGHHAYRPQRLRSGGRQALGYGTDERLIGFVYVGTIGSVVPAAPERAPHDNFVSEL